MTQEKKIRGVFTDRRITISHQEDAGLKETNGILQYILVEVFPVAGGEV